MQYPTDALTSSVFFDKEKDAFQFMEIKKKPRNTKKNLKIIPQDEQPTQSSLQIYEKKEEEERERRKEGRKKREDERKEDIKKEEKKDLMQLLL